MQAVILAAGMGKRLKELTKDKTKCMVEIAGESLIERLLKQLDGRNLNRIIIVVGYRSEDLKQNITDLHIKTKVEYIENVCYAQTNNIYSFWLAKKKMQEDDTLLFESDLLFEDSIIDDLIRSEFDSVALVDQYDTWMDGSCLKIGDKGVIYDFISGKQLVESDYPHYYKTANTYKFSKEFMKKWYIPFLEAYMGAIGVNDYYEQVLKVILFLNNQDTIRAFNINGKIWYEIDDAQDIAIAEVLLKKDKNALRELNSEKIKSVDDFIDHYKL